MSNRTTHIHVAGAPIVSGCRYTNRPRIEQLDLANFGVLSWLTALLSGVFMAWPSPWLLTPLVLCGLLTAGALVRACSEGR